MSIQKIKPHMLENIPGNKVPEIVEAREDTNSLHDRFEKIDNDLIIAKNNSVSKHGDSMDGHLTLDGGATVPAGQVLNIQGTLNISGQITSVSGTETGGTYGISAVVGSVYEVELSSTEPQQIISFTPAEPGNFLVYICFRIEDENCLVKAQIDFRDGAGIQSIIPTNMVQEPGIYSLYPIFIHSVAMIPIILTMQTDKPGKVFVSSSMVGL